MSRLVIGMATERITPFSTVRNAALAEFRNPDIDFQEISYYAAPAKKTKYNSLDEVDPELLATFEKLGIPLNEQKMLSGVAVDVVFDSVSVATTFREKLRELGIIFCSFGCGQGTSGPCQKISGYGGAFHR